MATTMRYSISVFCFVLSVFTIKIYPQHYQLPLNKELNCRIENAANDTLYFHSAIKPYTLKTITLDTTVFKLQSHYTDPGKKTIILPIVNIAGSATSKPMLTYETGIGASLFLQLSKSLSLQSNIFGNLNKYYPYISERIDSYKVVPDWGKATYSNSGFYFFPVFTGIISYQPRKYVGLSIGYDKHVIGDGYRSLLLSDNAAPFPFAKLSVNFWRIEYMVIWAYLKDINEQSSGTGMVDKYGAIHYLDVNLTKRISVGFYEAIIWWGSDEETSRGFDLAYLNPVIFYRPVEYSMHSPDNANLGGNLKLRLWKKTFLYGQLFIDDMKIKELLNNSGWWGNKYGIQAGFKSYNLLNIRNLYVQSELNLVRPYTYSHSSSSLNYGTVYQPLAHPLGANFEELLGILRYSKARWSAMAKLTVARIGKDTSDISYGQNIYRTYDVRNRKGDYSTLMLQGKREMPVFSELRINFLASKKWDIHVYCSLKGYSKDLISKAPLMYMFTAGFSTLLYNNERDY